MYTFLQWTSNGALPDIGTLPLLTKLCIIWFDLLFLYLGYKAWKVEGGQHG